MSKPTVNIVTKIARQCEGEYIFVNVLGAFHLKENAQKFLESKKVRYGEVVNGVNCVVELAIIENVEILDHPDSGE